ncbi:MAG: hypothetical protein GY722_07870 [bacterium]|nr:hypothetical protein [bacterium]
MKWTALVLGLLAAVGVFVNGSGMSTLNSADDPASSADAPASSDLASLGPVTLIADWYGSRSATCHPRNDYHEFGGTSPWGSDFATVTSATPAAGLSFRWPPFVDVGYLTAAWSNSTCDEIAVGTVLGSIEGTLLDGSTYEITFIAA